MDRFDLDDCARDQLVTAGLTQVGAEEIGELVPLRSTTGEGT